MFNQIVIHRPLANGKIDLGLIAETLLFYKDVILLIDRGSLTQLIQIIGLENTISLAKNYNVKFSYHRQQFAALSRTVNGVRVHKFSAYEFGGQDKKQIHTVAQEIESTIRTELGNDRKTRRLSRQIIDLTASKIIPESDVKAIGDAAEEDIANPAYSDFAARTIISTLYPSFQIKPNDRLEITRVGDDGFLLQSTFDHNKLSELQRQQTGNPNDGFSAVHIASHIHDARAEAYYASSYMSGYVSTPISSALVKRRIVELVRRIERDALEIDLFQDRVLPDGRRIREAVNSGEISLTQVLKVLDKAIKFKNWISGLNPDDSLIKEYFDEVARESWIQGLPGRAMRWIVGIGAAWALSPVAGVAFSAFDNLLLDRIMRGWRPDQFVEGALSGLFDAKPTDN